MTTTIGAATTKPTNDEVRHYERVVQAAAARLVRSAELTRALDRDDLVSEGRMALVEALAGLEPCAQEHMVRMIQARVRHRMIDAIRRMSPYARDEIQARRDSPVPRHTRVCSLDEIASEGTLEIPSDRPSPETVVASAQIWRVVDELPPRERQALLLREVEGYSGPEVGARMGVTESRVCQLRNQAIARLRGHAGGDLAA